MTLDFINPYADFYNNYKDLLYLQSIITPREYGMRYRKHNKSFKRK